MKNQLKTVLCLLFISAMLSSCCRYKIVNCPPDQRPVNFPANQKCAKKYYEDAVKSTNIGAGAIADIFSKFKINANVDIKKDSELLAEKFSNQTSQLREQLKTSFLSFSIDPCGSADRHYDLLNALNEKNSEIEMFKAELSRANSDAELKNALDFDRIRGEREGRNVGFIAGRLKRYYKNNGESFPSSLKNKELDIEKQINELGESRLDYRLNSDGNITLRYAGRDYALNTIDDKVYKSENGEIIEFTP